MSKDKIKYQPVNKGILIRAKVKLKIGNTLLPYNRADFKEILNRKKEPLFYDERVLGIGDKVDIKGLEIGSEVHTKKHGMKFLDDDKLKEFHIEFVNTEEEQELVYLIEEENMLAIIK